MTSSSCAMNSESKFKVEADGGLSLTKTDIHVQVPDFIKKRFHSVLDLPESWETNVNTTNVDNDVYENHSVKKRIKREDNVNPVGVSHQLKSIVDVDSVEEGISCHLNSSEENFTSQQPRIDVRKKRRNAIIPNSMTQRMIKNVADGYHLEADAENRGIIHAHTV